MIDQQFQSCIDACNNCAAACDNCATACLQEADAKQLARCIALDMDCAQICRLAASYMARGSELTGAICEACAEVCGACADESAQHQMDHCKQCALACEQCLDECRRMISAIPAEKRHMGTSSLAH